MTKSKHYHLNYKMLFIDDRNIPVIECDADAAGTTLHIELKSFLEKGGA